MALDPTQTFAPDDTAHVTIVEDGRSWRRVLAPDGVWTIGRSEGCELRLEDAAASRRHAELRCERGVATIVDLGSHNGTFVNGERLAARGARVLGAGDVIAICATTIAYYAPVRRRRGARLVEPAELLDAAAAELDRALSRGRRAGILIAQLPDPAKPEHAGKPAPDPELLAATARAFAATLRPSDLVAVDGATRIVAVLAEVDADELAAHARALRSAAAAEVASAPVVGAAIAPEVASTPVPAVPPRTGAAIAPAVASAPVPAVPPRTGAAIAPELASAPVPAVPPRTGAAIAPAVASAPVPRTSAAIVPAGAAVAVRAASAAAIAIRTGGAIAPDDANDVAVLLAAARDAAAAAAPGEHATATQAVRALDLGGKRILVAEPAMLRVYALVERMAPSDLPILVLGETGVGKESVVAAVHHLSPRRAGPLVAVNCAALPDTLAESALFGHERGAFSGATSAQPGRFEAADGGTLFLDEVGELSPAIQAKLLRALDDKVITRLGATAERTVDVRVVAATNRDLRAEITAGRFREDLWYRLGGAIVRVPPLRERPRDVLVLARELLAQACARLGRPVPAIGVGALEALAGHAWPGNVRELRNAMDYAAAAVDGDDLERWHLPAELAGAEPPAPAAPAADDAGPATPSQFRPIAEELRELERRRMIQALTVAGGVQTRAAELLHMPRRTFVTRMREYDLHALFPRSM